MNRSWMYGYVDQRREKKIVKEEWRKIKKESWEQKESEGKGVKDRKKSALVYRLTP